jgi:quercetin dioxygenase-like cupin family protein
MSVVHAETPKEAGALVVRSGQGETLRWGPTGKVRILAGSSSTDRSFSVVECVEPPGSGAPLHVHHAEAEAFYILEGVVELTCGAQKVTTRAGDFVYTPKDVAHKFTVVGDQPARLLMMFSRPGFEMFFAEGGSPIDQPPAGSPDVAGFRRLVEKYSMELLDAPAH